MVITFVLVLASVVEAVGWFWPVAQGVGFLNQARGLTACQVLVIYDGDTLGCDLDGNQRINGQEEHVRLLGIDATEMHYSRKNKTGQDEPGAREAKTYLEQTLLHKTAYLEFDVVRYDPYQRTLAYVYQDMHGKTMLNQALLERGLAKTLFLGQNRRYQSAFEQIIEAREKGT